jgi:2,3-bisphosphoglycerate-dependent phosphoglycerate mutase
MERLIKITFLLLLSIFELQAVETTIILSRHAEKGSGQNPSLSSAGQERAVSLIKLSNNFQISGVYSSSAKRTLQTGKPLADLFKLSIEQSISPFAYKELLKDIMDKYAGETVFIVGHSNTIPEFINFSLPEQTKEIKFKTIKENDFSNLFIVKYNKDIKSSLINYRYKPLKAGKELLILPLLPVTK